MKRIAATTLALAMTAAAGSAFAYDDYAYQPGQGDQGENYGYESERYEGQREEGPRYDMAQVVGVEPIVEPGRTTQRQECWSEPQRGYSRGDYYRDGYYRDGRRYRNSGPNGGTVLGAIIGGSLGNLAGKGEGRHAATIAGVVIGGAIGTSIANDNRNDDYRHYDGRQGRIGYDDSYQSTTRQCRTVSDYERDERVVGYNVSFDYHGQVYHTTTNHHPGNTIRVRVDVTAADDRVAGY